MKFSRGKVEGLNCVEEPTIVVIYPISFVLLPSFTYDYTYYTDENWSFSPQLKGTFTIFVPTFRATNGGSRYGSPNDTNFGVPLWTYETSWELWINNQYPLVISHGY